VASDKSVVAAAADAQCSSYVPACTLMSLIMKAGLSLDVFWQGTSKTLPCIVYLFHVQDTRDWGYLHLVKEW